MCSPSASTSASWTIFTTIWPGVTLLSTALADGAFAHLGDEILHHRQRDIGLEQRDAHLAQGRVDIGLAQRAAPRQPSEDIAQPFGQPLEHQIPMAKTAQNTKAPVRETRGRTGPLGAKLPNFLRRAETSRGRCRN